MSSKQLKEKEKSKKGSSTSTKLQIRKTNQRYFSEAFKREKVQDLVEKRISIANFCKLYGVSRTTAYNWLYAYSNLEQGTRKVIVAMAEPNSRA